MMGPYSSILDQDHVVDFVDGKSQRHLFDNLCFIGDHVWLGEKAIVLKGVSIGSYSVIGAGAVVTKSIPEWSIAVGCQPELSVKYPIGQARRSSRRLLETERS